MRSRKPIKTKIARKNDKMAEIQTLIRNEKDRHLHKIQNLGAETMAAKTMKSEDMRNLAIVRISGRVDDEKEKHRARIKVLEDRLAKVWR